MYRKSKKPRVGYVYGEKGLTTWKKETRIIDEALKGNFINYHAFKFNHKSSLKGYDVIFGESDFCLKHFVEANKHNPLALKILRRTSAPVEIMLDLVDKERNICGIKPFAKDPIEVQNSKREIELANYILLSSNVSRRAFLEAGYPEYKLKVITPGIDTHKPYFRKRKDDIKFLFVASDPFRKGVRILFEAWDRLKLKNAQLICITTREILDSRLLTEYFFKNPSIVTKKFESYNKFLSEYKNIDCQVLPSLSDGFSITIAEGMGYGKPAIVSDATGVADIIIHLQDGYIVKSGSVTEVENALRYFYEDRKRIKEMGEAAFETARQYTWQRFEKNLIDLILSLWTK